MNASSSPRPVSYFFFFVPSFYHVSFLIYVRYFPPNTSICQTIFLVTERTRWVRRSSLSTLRLCTECQLPSIRYSTPVDTLGRMVRAVAWARAPPLAAAQARVPLLGETFMVSRRMPQKKQ